MAKTVITSTRYIDDLDGSKAEGSVEFSFNGKNYEIDLSKANTRALESTLKPYISAGRIVRATSRRARSARGGASPIDLSNVREWARANGYSVSERGRIAGDVLEAYNSAH